MRDKVDLAEHGLSAGDLLAFLVSALTILTSIIVYITTPRNHKTNISSETSPVVHSFSAWYGSTSNTAPRIVLGTVDLILLLTLALQSLGVKLSKGLNISILVAVGITEVLLLLYLIPLSSPRNYKTNMSSTMSPLVLSSSVRHGSKPALQSGEPYTMQSPSHYSELASRCPRPRMIVRA